ncbi:MAG: cob(I)yrinic acid a,c-diamide adenosyltransferase [Sedimentisphaerales bacterium]|nr:cob(I)yrinic acid a,c-diamide adenosyltransferase [Sedimentisphaerales bacterium]
MQSQFQKFTRQRLSAGYVHVYTGDGKGKTTAAIGLAIRAAGAGLRVLFTQFIKGSASSEIDALKMFSDQITVRQYGRGRFIRDDSSSEDRDAAENGLAEIEQALSEEDYDMIVLDEANMAIQCHLFSIDRLINLIVSKPPDVEMVITGRNAHPSLLDYADVVTEMKEIKHYYHKGIMARVGIEK